MSTLFPSLTRCVVPAPSRWQRLLNWWYRLTGRHRYYVSMDRAYDDGPDYWVEMMYDRTTYVYTVIAQGRGPYLKRL